MGLRRLVAVTVYVVWAQVFWSQRRLETVLAPPQNHARNEWVTRVTSSGGKGEGMSEKERWGQTMTTKENMLNKYKQEKC